MKGTPQQENCVFAESVKNHQRLVDILIKAKNKAGVSQISQPEMARLMSRSQAWVGKAIKRINTENTCIEKIAQGKYVVHYSNIMDQGVFVEIMKLIIECYDTPELFRIKDSIIATERGIKVKTVQMFKAYLRTS